MKFLFSFCFSLIFSGIILGQESTQWKHFYGSHAPLKISTSSNRVAMTGGKGLMRYNIDSESIQHFNILDIPDMPTNDWSNVLENTGFNALWAVPTENQVKDLAPIYRYDENDGEWVGNDLDSMFNAEFDYDKLGTSPSGRILIPGIRTETDGTEQLLIAIHQNDHSWELKTVMDNPGSYSAPIGAAFNQYFIDAGINKGIYALPSSWAAVIDLSNDLDENYTPNHHLIDARKGQLSQSAYFINDGIRIFEIDFLTSIDLLITEYETEDFGLPGDFIIEPKDVIFDRDRYFWAVGNNQLWRFKTDEPVRQFSLNGFETSSFGDWQLLLTDTNRDLWLQRRNTSGLWKYSVTNGMQNMNFGNSEMPLRGVTPLGIIGNHGLVFDTWKQNTKFRNGDFLDINLDLEVEEGTRVWHFTLSNKSVAYGRKRADKYFIQEANSDERQVYYPQTEEGESLSLQSIESMNSRGDLLGYVDPYSSTSIRQYYFKRKDNDYWEKVTHSINQDSLIENFIFYDDDHLIGTQRSSASEQNLYWYDINATTNPMTTETISENISNLSIVKSEENIWMYNSGKIGRMIEGSPIFTSTTDIGIPDNEELRNSTPDNQGNIWLTTSRGRVLLWNGEEILDQFHTGNSGLPFKPDDIYLDPLNNLWMCKFKRGCTVYNEAGVDFDYEKVGEEEEFAFGERPFVISPNPVRDLLTIRSTFDINSINIYDALGKKLQSTILETTDYWEINTSNWASGIYFGTINSGLSRQTFKFIKQ